MNVTDLHPDLGRPVLYYPGLRDLCGSANAGLLYSHFTYWTGKGSEPGGWIYKSAEQIQDETGLTYEEQLTARAKLRERGLLQERYLRGEHTIYYRITGAVTTATARPSDLQVDHQGNPAALNKGLPIRSSGHSPDAHQGNSEMLIKGIPSSLNSNSKSTTESTSESTSERTSGNAKGIEQFAQSSEWRVAHDLPIPAVQLERERLIYESTAAFESALRVNGWPWSTTRIWEKMSDLVAAAWRADPEVFREYVHWMEGDGRFVAMNVKQIRISPQQFIDTGWPLFMASRRQEEPEAVQVETEMTRRIRERMKQNERTSSEPAG